MVAVVGHRMIITNLVACLGYKIVASYYLLTILRSVAAPHYVVVAGVFFNQYKKKENLKKQTFI